MKHLLLIIGVLILIAFLAGKVKAGNSESLKYREFELEGSCGIKRFVDPDNGNICYTTNACGYKGLGISCIPQNKYVPLPTIKR